MPLDRFSLSNFRQKKHRIKPNPLDKFQKLLFQLCLSRWCCIQYVWMVVSIICIFFFKSCFGLRTFMFTILEMCFLQLINEFPNKFKKKELSTSTQVVTFKTTIHSTKVSADRKHCYMRKNTKLRPSGLYSPVSLNNFGFDMNCDLYKF